MVAVAPCPPSAPSQTAISRSDELTKASFADLLVLAEILELREEELARLTRGTSTRCWSE